MDSKSFSTYPCDQLFLLLLTLLKAIPIFCHLLRGLEIAIPFIVRQTQLSRRSISNTDLNISMEWKLIKSFSLLALGIWLSTLSTLNFSLGFFVGLLCAPLAFLLPSERLANRHIWPVLVAIALMQLISPLNWFYLISRLEFGVGVSELATLYRFGWKIWGSWTPLVWWCIWWPAWLAGLVVVASPD